MIGTTDIRSCRSLRYGRGMAERVTTQWRIGAVIPGLALGVLAAAVGLLPWLVTGARLPLQNLWATQVLPEDMPIALLPLSQYYATRLLVLLIVGGALAGFATRLVPRETTPLPVATGLLLGQAAATIQTAVVVIQGHALGAPTADPRAALYVYGMLTGAVVAVALAQAVFWLSSHTARGPAALGLGLAAVPAGSWGVDLVATSTDALAAPDLALGVVARWLPAVIAGVAIGWCGIRPRRRMAVWAVVLAGLWLIPALLTAVQYGLGMRVLAGDLGEMARASLDVFPLVVAQSWPPVLVALVLGALVTLWRARRERRLLA